MPIDRSRTPLYITLIVFVMLSFVLAITTYLFFQRRTDALQQLDAAAAERDTALRDKATADSEKKRLFALIGTVKQNAVDNVESECKELFAKYFSSDDRGEPTFISLVQRLNAELEALQKKGRDRDQEKAELELARAKALEQAEESRAQAEQQVAEAREEMANAKQEFQRQRGEAEKAMEDIRGKQDNAEQRGTQLELLVDGVKKLGGLLTNDVRRIHPKEEENQKRKAQESKGRKDRFEAEESAAGKIALVEEELKFAQATIQDLNATLAKLRVAEPSLQLAVRRAMPRDDIIDGFDGRVIEVDEADRSVLLWMPSTAAMRPGLVFSVFDPGAPRPAQGDRKATVQVVQVEGNSVARARIESDSLDEPILAGDAVASSLWSPGVVTEIVIVGYVDIPGSDNGYGTLKADLERAGARVSEVVTARTSLVVDAKEPSRDQVAAGRAKNWRKPDADRRDAETRKARESGVRVVGLEGLFDTLGLDPLAFRGSVLPRAGSAGTP